MNSVARPRGWPNHCFSRADTSVMRAYYAPGMNGLQRNVPLAPLTTLGIGGPGKFLVEVTNLDQIREAVEWAKSKREPLLVLAGGSNVLIADEGFNGLVMHLALRGITTEGDGAIKVAAGEPWDDIVAMAVEKRWAGIECLSGIPGSTGATPIQNVGAYGQEVSETIIRVEVLERESGRVITLTNWDCGFGYRSSIFKGSAKETYVVLAVTCGLRPNGAATVRYAELRKYLEEHSAPLDDLPQVRHAVLTIRRRKG